MTVYLDEKHTCEDPDCVNEDDCVYQDDLGHYFCGYCLMDYHNESLKRDVQPETPKELP